MQIEAGKYYMTRDGAKVGPIVSAENSEFANTDFQWVADIDGEHATWYPEGNYFMDGECERDLIVECETDTELTAIDHLREAATLFVLAGQDQAAIDVLGLVIEYEVTK